MNITTNNFIFFFPESERTGPPVGGRTRARRAPAVARGDMTDVDESAVDKMPHSGKLGSQRAVSRREQLRPRLLSVSRNQAAGSNGHGQRAVSRKEQLRLLLLSAVSRNQAKARV